MDYKTRALILAARALAEHIRVPGEPYQKWFNIAIEYLELELDTMAETVQ